MTTDNVTRNDSYNAFSNTLASFKELDRLAMVKAAHSVRPGSRELFYSLSSHLEILYRSVEESLDMDAVFEDEFWRATYSLSKPTKFALLLHAIRRSYLLTQHVYESYYRWHAEDEVRDLSKALTRLEETYHFSRESLSEDIDEVDKFVSDIVTSCLVLEKTNPYITDEDSLNIPNIEDYKVDYREDFGAFLSDFDLVWDHVDCLTESL